MVVYSEGVRFGFAYIPCWAFVVLWFQVSCTQMLVADYASSYLADGGLFTVVKVAIPHGVGCKLFILCR